MWRIVVFTLDEVRYGIRIEDVDQLARMVATVPLPGAPPIIEGAIDVRGTVVPVLDLRGRFGHPARPPALSDRLIVAHAGDRRVALRADAVLEVVDVEPSAAALHNLGGAATTRIAGVAALPDGLVFIHELSTFLDEAEAVTLDDAMAALA